MPKRPIKRATYVAHADAYTTRPTINEQRYYIGYWPTEAQAIDAGNRFKDLAELDSDPAYLKRIARDFCNAASNQRQDRHDRNADGRYDNRREPPKRVRTILQELTREIDLLHGRLNDLEQRLNAS